VRYLLAFLLLTASLLASPTSLKDLYGARGLDIIGNPDTVSAILLKDRNGDPKARSKKVPLTPEQKRVVSAALLDRRIYGFDSEGTKVCLPIWNARLLFTKGSESRQIDFCFHCNVLSIHSAPEQSTDADFDPAHAILLGIFKQAFPKDKFLQHLDD